MTLPLFKNMYRITLEAVRELGGVASIDDVERVVADKLNLSIEDRKKLHRENQTKLSERVAWARLYLKKEGFLASSKKGACVLSEKGKNVDLDTIE